MLALLDPLGISIDPIRRPLLLLPLNKALAVPLPQIHGGLKLMLGEELTMTISTLLFGTDHDDNCCSPCSFLSMLKLCVAPSCSGLTAAVAALSISGANAALNQAETDLADLEVTEASVRVQLKAKKLELSRCPLALEIQRLEEQLVQVGDQKRGQVSLIGDHRWELGLPCIEEIGGDKDDISFMSETQARPFLGFAH